MLLYSLSMYTKILAPSFNPHHVRSYVSCPDSRVETTPSFICKYKHGFNLREALKVLRILSRSVRKFIVGKTRSKVDGDELIAETGSPLLRGTDVR